MERIPISIREISTSRMSDREIVARFDYHYSVQTLQSILENVRFGKPYPFAFIVGKEYSQSVINEWVKAHNNKWSAASFLFDKIVENGGSLS